MRVEQISPDLPAPSQSVGEGADFARALDAVGAALAGANRAEDAFAYGSGSLENAIYERARADVALSVATATAQRLAQAVQSVLNMQV
jgi:flagellar hook-basal body complex protein FliE